MKILAKKKKKNVPALPNEAEISVVPKDATVELPELLTEEEIPKRIL